jgi:hypothetical protein
LSFLTRAACYVAACGWNKVATEASPPAAQPLRRRSFHSEVVSADDPPVILSGFQGLRTGPKQPVVPVPAKAISSRFNLPSKTTPARFSRLATSPSSLRMRSFKIQGQHRYLGRPYHSGGPRSHTASARQGSRKPRRQRAPASDTREGGMISKRISPYSCPFLFWL